MALYIDDNDATRATNKQYALQKSSYCPILPFPGLAQTGWTTRPRSYAFRLA